MGLISRFLDLFRKKEIRIEADSLDEFKINKALQYENAEVKAERDKYKLQLAKIKQTKEEKEDKKV